MDKLRTILVLALGLVASTASSVQAQAWAAKMFPELTHDFGTVSRNAKTEYVFVVENIYEEELHIASVRSSCGCTAAKILKNNLKTWEKGGIVAEFNTRSFIGQKNAALTVVIDRPYYAEIQLLVSGKIRSDIVTEPGQIDFGPVAEGTDRIQLLKISYAGRPNWTIKDVRGDSKFLEVRVQKKEQRGNQTNYVFEVKLRGDAPAGLVHDDLVFVTDDTINDHFTLPVAARIASALEIAPAIVDLGQLETGNATQQRFVVKGKEPFEIRDIVADDQRLKFSHPGGKKLVHVVTVAVDDANESDIQSDVRVVSDLESKVSVSCKVVGQSRK